MIIDKSYFIGEINIPNTDKTAIGELVDKFIEKYEPKFLDETLGYNLAKAFRAGLDEYTVDQKWTDLLEGVEYVDANNKTRYWVGFITESFPKSPIANYVYYWFIRNNHTQTATMGEVKSQNENAVNVSPTLKMVQAWNEISAWVCELVDYLNAKETDYPEWENQDVWCMLKKFHPINEFGI